MNALNMELKESQEDSSFRNIPDISCTISKQDGSSSTLTEFSENTTEEEEDSKCWKKSWKILKRRLPITKWLPKYGKEDAAPDIISGLTVGLTVVPQSMAYAAIAGLSPEYGLYSSYIGVLVYIFLGSCKQVTIGPTAIMSLLTFQTCGNNNPSCAILAGFYSGVFELLMAFLQLGWLVSFISEPVTIGFTSAAAVTIISSQISSFLGILGESGDGFLDYWETIFYDIRKVQLADSVMGISSFVLLLLLRKLKDVPTKEGKLGKTLKNFMWLTSLSRNVIIVISTSIIAYSWTNPPFKLVGSVQAGFPQVKPPQFFLPINSTYSESSHTFLESWSILKSGPFVIAIISILQNVAISKAFGSGQFVDATQEMYALGIVNIFGGFFNSMPTSASFSRSAVNEASGVRSPLGGLYAGILVLLSLGFLTQSFYYIPKSSLAAVIIAAVMFMIDYESLIPMWKISRVDFWACLVTFFISLFIGMEYGILVGVIVSVSALLMKNLRPPIEYELKSDEGTGVQYLLIQAENGLIFPSVDHVSTSIQKICAKNKSCRVIAISFAKWKHYDYTAANTLATFANGMKKHKKVVIFLDCDLHWISALEFAGMKNPPCVSSSALSDFLNENSVVALNDLNVFVNFPKP